ADTLREDVLRAAAVIVVTAAVTVVVTVPMVMPSTMVAVVIAVSMTVAIVIVVTDVAAVHTADLVTVSLQEVQVGPAVARVALGHCQRRRYRQHRRRRERLRVVGPARRTIRARRLERQRQARVPTALRRPAHTVAIGIVRRIRRAFVAHVTDA